MLYTASKRRQKSSEAGLSTEVPPLKRYELRFFPPYLQNQNSLKLENYGLNVRVIVSIVI
ncbi:hypothetical protein KC19_N038800 [Ceratodon purpureus]|nr:hypothetical protein KC19_N038800 [Ceratodon purpureus]